MPSSLSLSSSSDHGGVVMPAKVACLSYCTSRFTPTLWRVLAHTVSPSILHVASFYLDGSHREDGIGPTFPADRAGNVTSEMAPQIIIADQARLVRTLGKFGLIHFISKLSTVIMVARPQGLCGYGQSRVQHLCRTTVGPFRRLTAASLISPEALDRLPCP